MLGTDFTPIKDLDTPGDRFTLSHTNHHPWYEITARPEQVAPGMLKVHFVRIDAAGKPAGEPGSMVWPATYHVNAEQRIRTLQVRCLLCGTTFDHTQETSYYRRTPERNNCGRHEFQPDPVSYGWSFALCRVKRGLLIFVQEADSELAALRLLLEASPKHGKRHLKVLAAVDVNGNPLSVPVVIATSYKTRVSFYSRAKATLVSAGFDENGRDLLQDSARK